jgi:1-deoxy-D-xylulose-5-phosphate synthase
MDEAELRNLMYTAQLPDQQGPFAIRYPRGQGVMPEWRTPFQPIEIGKGRQIKAGEDVAILTIGHVGNSAKEACEALEDSGASIAHFDMRFVKPLDEEMLHEIFSKFNKIVTVEDGCLPGGFGSAVLEFMADHGYAANVRRLGIPDRVIEHGEPKQLHTECGYDSEAISAAVIALMEPLLIK